MDNQNVKPRTKVNGGILFSPEDCRRRIREHEEQKKKAIEEYLLNREKSQELKEPETMVVKRIKEYEEQAKKINEDYRYKIQELNMSKQISSSAVFF